MRGVCSLLLFALTACTGGDDSGALTSMWAMDEAIQVVPGDAMPEEAWSMPSNNNLDVVVHEGETFLVFRTAPTHFASDQTLLHVVRSADLETWTYETSFFYETDLREPRFLSWEGELLLYFARLGSDPGAFEPGDTMLTVRGTDGSWSEPEIWFVQDFIPWRLRTFEDDPGVAHLIGYEGGGDIYDMGELPALQVFWLTSTDGRTWEPRAGDGIVLEGGVSETDFTILDDGTVVAVSRNEAGDEDGWGSKICRGEASDPTNWTCKSDPRKYDSPLVFRQPTIDDPDAVWLVGRRHLSETGNYDLTADGEEPQETHGQQTLFNQVAYWNEAKRCALWQVDPVELEVRHVWDLPSSGDTCFPSILPREGVEGGWTIWNYSSPLDEDPTWLEGQNGDTHIYRMDVTLEEIEIVAH